MDWLTKRVIELLLDCEGDLREGNAVEYRVQLNGIVYVLRVHNGNEESYERIG